MGSPKGYMQADVSLRQYLKNCPQEAIEYDSSVQFIPGGNIHFLSFLRPITKEQPTAGSGRHEADKRYETQMFVLGTEVDKHDIAKIKKPEWKPTVLIVPYLDFIHVVGSGVEPAEFFRNWKQEMRPTGETPRQLDVSWLP